MKRIEDMISIQMGNRVGVNRWAEVTVGWLGETSSIRVYSCAISIWGLWQWPVIGDQWSVITDHWSLSSSPRIRGPHLLTIFVHFPGQERARPSPFCTHQWSGSKAHDLHDPIIYQCPVNTNSSHHSFHFISFPFLPSPSHLPSVTSSELIIITLYPIPYFFNSLILISFILCIFLPFSSVWAYRRAGPYNHGSCGLLGLVG